MRTKSAESDGIIEIIPGGPEMNHQQKCMSSMIESMANTAVKQQSMRVRPVPYSVGSLQV